MNDYQQFSPSPTGTHIFSGISFCVSSCVSSVVHSCRPPQESSKKKESKFVIYKNIIDHDILDKYLFLSKKYTEKDSKFGNIVQKNIKIRKDIFFRRDDSKLLDKIILNILPKVEKEFGIKIKYRENYKLGKYYGDDKGFYNPHTDIQGFREHRKISMIICLSDENDYKGGIFKLVNLNKKFKLNKGDLLLFKSDLLHGVEPVTDGIRQVIISFMWDEDSEKLRMKNYPNSKKKYQFNIQNQ